MKKIASIILFALGGILLLGLLLGLINLFSMFGSLGLSRALGMLTFEIILALVIVLIFKGALKLWRADEY